MIPRLCLIFLFVITHVSQSNGIINSSKTNESNKITTTKIGGENPILQFIIRKILVSYVKRQTKKYIRNRVVRFAANQSADYAIGNAISSVANELNYFEQSHVKDHWTYIDKDVNHTYRCQTCNKICRRVEDRINKYDQFGISSPFFRESQKYHKGTKLVAGLTLTMALDKFYQDFFKTSDAFLGYSLGLEHNVGYAQIEGGFKYYATTNDQYKFDTYSERSAYINICGTIPTIPEISPYIGPGYMYNKVTVEENGTKNNLDNSSFLLLGGVDLKLSEHIYLSCRYNRTLWAPEFDKHIIEGAIKIDFNISNDQ